MTVAVTPSPPPGPATSYPTLSPLPNRYFGP